MTKSQEIINGLREGFKNGTTKMADRVCYGYAKASDGRLSINEDDATVIRWIFRHYLAGDSLGKIANGLAKKSIPSPTGKTHWNSETIHKLLSNEKYAGNIKDDLRDLAVHIAGHKTEPDDLAGFMNEVAAVKSGWYDITDDVGVMDRRGGFVDGRHVRNLNTSPDIYHSHSVLSWLDAERHEYEQRHSALEISQLSGLIDNPRIFSTVRVGLVDKETGEVTESLYDEAAEYRDHISHAMTQFSNSEYSSNDLMQHFQIPDNAQMDASIKEKVQSAQVSVCSVQNKLFAVLNIEMTADLTVDELDAFKDQIESQYRDGWGAEFELLSIPAGGKDAVCVRLYHDGLSFYTADEFHAMQLSMI